MFKELETLLEQFAAAAKARVEAAEAKAEAAIKAAEDDIEAKVEAAIAAKMGGSLDLSGFKAAIADLGGAPAAEKEPEPEHQDGSFQVEHA